MSLESIHQSFQGLANILYTTVFVRYGVNYVGTLTIDRGQSSEFSTCGGRLNATAFIEFRAVFAFQWGVAWELSNVWDFGCGCLSAS